MAKESLLDKVNRQELQETDTPKKRIITKIADTDTAKDKQISAKINSGVYEQFTRINKAMGISNNSALNLCITKYVRENRAILED